MLFDPTTNVRPVQPGVAEVGAASPPLVLVCVTPHPTGMASNKATSRIERVTLVMGPFRPFKSPHVTRGRAGLDCDGGSALD